MSQEEQKNLGKVPEVHYNSRKLVTMARDPNFFRQQLPRVIREVIESEPPQLKSTQAAHTLQQMYNVTYALWNEGADILLMDIYGDYARERGLEVERDTETFGRIKTIKRFEELSPEEAREWQVYLDTTDVPRQKAIDAIGTINSRFDLPSIRYIEDPSVQFLHRRLQTVPYHVTLTIFPDISDEEAHTLFRQNTTVEDIHRLAIDPV